MVVVFELSCYALSALRRALCAILFNITFFLFIPNKFSLLLSLCRDFYRMLFGIICPKAPTLNQDRPAFVVGKIVGYSVDYPYLKGLRILILLLMTIVRNSELET